MSLTHEPSPQPSPRGRGSPDELLARPQIAVALGGPTTDDAMRAYESITDRAGIVELRVDLFSEPADLSRLISLRPCPVVVTCRASIEGGSFRGSESKRLDILRQAAAFGADFVDVEHFAFHDLGTVAPTRVIVSQHDFASMPSDLAGRYADIRTLGADIVKVAGMATDSIDLLPVLDVLARADVPTIAMAMGPAGMASRVVAFRYPNCVLTYASLDGDAGTAPGQMSLSEMHEVYHAQSITESTQVFGVIAPSIEFGLVAILNGLLRDKEIDAVCVPLPTLRPSIELLRALIPHGFVGFHVHGEGQQSLRREMHENGLDSENTDRLNSVTVVEGDIVGSHVSSPAEQIRDWLAHVS